MKHIIWTNNVDDSYFDYYFNEEQSDLSEERKAEIISSLLDSSLEDERANLDIVLDSPIIVIGDIGRWNGRVAGYKIIKSGNIKDCLCSDTDFVEWYVDEDGDLKCTASHHDGINSKKY